MGPLLAINQGFRTSWMQACPCYSEIMYVMHQVPQKNSKVMESYFFKADTRSKVLQNFLGLHKLYIFFFRAKFHIMDTCCSNIILNIRMSFLGLNSNKIFFLSKFYLYFTLLFKFYNYYILNILLSS
jgi:hypothetical protein